MIDQLLGHYRIISKLGEGGMGAVYRARDEVLHREVAIKVVARGAGLDQSSREFLLHEARASSALSHPNICTVHEIGEFNGELYIVMELVEGRSLASMIGSLGLVARIGDALRRANSKRAGPFSWPLYRSPGS
jgi:serine/threonine protein kinase